MPQLVPGRGIFHADANHTLRIALKQRRLPSCLKILVALSACFGILKIAVKLSGAVVGAP